MAEEIEKKPVSDLKLAKADFSQFNPSVSNPWASKDIDKMEALSLKEYKKIVEACRFFYQRDPLASTVINKIVEIGINELDFSQGSLSENELRVFTSLSDKLQEFAEAMALEYLISGLVIPEIKYAPVGGEELKLIGIKKYPNLTLPVNLWLRDPSTIKINKSLLSDEPSYFVQIPEEIVYFILNGGRYKDGTKDPDLFAKLLAYYPAFVQEVKDGVRETLLENDLIFRRKVLSNTAYPIPYLYPAIEPMKHKRNLRRMDYAIAARVIGAIQLIQLGSDEFPVTADEQGQFDDIKNQMLWRDGTGVNIERIFQLFANHTLKITWIVPPTEALLADSKYKDINQEIIFALGFPRILITGESERTGTSDPQYATMSPVKTMENIRRRILQVIRRIVIEISQANKFTSSPEVNFRPLQLSEFKAVVDALSIPYEKGDISRTSYMNLMGYNWKDENETRKVEDKTLGPEELERRNPTPVVKPEGTTKTKPSATVK